MGHHEVWWHLPPNSRGMLAPTTELTRYMEAPSTEFTRYGGTCHRVLMHEVWMRLPPNLRSLVEPTTEFTLYGCTYHRIHEVWWHLPPNSWGIPAPTTAFRRYDDTYHRIRSHLKYFLKTMLNIMGRKLVYNKGTKCEQNNSIIFIIWYNMLVAKEINE